VLTTSAHDAETDIRHWLTDWFDLVGSGELAQACGRIDRPAGSGHRWTPKMLRHSIEDTFGPGTRFQREHPEGPVFTPASTARGEAHVSIIPYADGTGYSVNHDVPLNGAFSDLTAQFEFTWDGPALRISLYDLHVM
jgi:hypothetical protein